MAAKIKDGLFVGDADTSRDVEFLELSKSRFYTLMTYSHRLFYR